MAPKGGYPIHTSSTSKDSLAPNGPSSPSLPRSTSPSSNFASFLTRPSKWFNRSTSMSKLTQSTTSTTSEARSSTSTASGRKHKISRPTDPRPILDSYGSKSVLDLSARPAGSFDSPFHPPSTPSSPTAYQNSGGLGDLRNISRRGWSRSADDLSKVSPGNLSPLNTSFQERIAEYRGRSHSNASAPSPSSPSSAVKSQFARHPFPSTATSPSTSPPRSNTLPSVSISVSAPVLEDDLQSPISPDSPHFHSRSHSFTPKLPSKLATPRFPPSPKRKGSGTSEREVDVKESEKPPAQPQTRGAFGFGFNVSKPPSDPNSNFATNNAANNRNTTLLAPPLIIEPGEEEIDGNSKRSSQIVYHSGFINRLADLPNNPHHTNISLAKGGKPYKLELKGSKLYFYKPPSDRNAAIKDLFPTGLVPPSQDEDDETDGDAAESDEHEGGNLRSRKGRGRDDASVGRRKRAFWGRRTHPDLVRDSAGKIEKGTSEALTHEAVFATTFKITADDEQRNGTTDQDTLYQDEWKEFALSILLSLPSIIGRAAFEAEFLRCCSFLVSGADVDSQIDMKERVSWLAKEYITYHGAPADQAAWDEWKRDTIPDTILNAEVTLPASNIPSSASMQALYHPTPMLGTSSPHVNTFSPRPEDDVKHVSLTEALNSREPAPSSPSKSRPSLDLKALEKQSIRPGLIVTTNRLPWSALNEEGLSREVLLMLNPYLIAQSLMLYHRSILDRAPENITAEFILGADLQSQDEGESSSASFSSLFGSDDQPNWLTKLLLLQILGSDTSNGNNASPNNPASPSRKSEDRSAQTSRTHSRSEVISVWARVGELCRSAGDECSWKAISAALCSRPVARLDKAWKRVDPQAVATISSWVHESDVEHSSVNEPKITPWGGDIKFRIKDELAKARGEQEDQMVQYDALVRARNLFDAFRTTFLLCPRKINVVEGEIGDDVRRMVAYWQEMSAEGGGIGNIAAKFQKVEQFMSLSLAAEPRRKGHFEPYFWSRSAIGHVPQTSLIPLLFPEPLPTVALIDRSQLVRGRVDSDAPDIPYLRGFDQQLRPEVRRNLLQREGNQDATRQAILGQGGTTISVYNGDLLLVVQPTKLDSSSSRPSSSRAPSRPPSSATDSFVDRPVSRTPSIRAKTSASQGLERKTSMARRSSLPSVPQRQNLVITELSSEPPLRVIVQAGTLNHLVNILVYGLRNITVSVADDNGEMSLREGKTRELVVDHAEFAKVWWNVFRSFVTPFVFFELLRKLYISSQPVGSDPPVSEYYQVIHARTSVLEIFKEWMTSGGGAQDVLDDSQLYNAIQTFLDSPSDHIIYQSSNVENLENRQLWINFAQTRQSLNVVFLSQTMRPTIVRTNLASQKPVANSSSGRMRSLSTREPPQLDTMDPEDLVDNLDGMACAAFSNVTEEDLYITADLLEIQSADRTGWFSNRDPGTSEDTVEIQTIYSLIQEVDPSPLISEMSHDVLYRVLPPGIRSCIRAYGIIRKWLISRIVSPRLGLRNRQARMELLLRAVEVARLRNLESTSSARLAESPCIRSFVEAVITSAILSIESRMHQRAWQSVASARGNQCDTFSSILSNPFVQSTSSKESLTLDMGWLLERMLEIIATPDVIESSSQDGQSLVNFDKRRQLCKLIDIAPSLPSSRKIVQTDEVYRRGFERLNHVEKEVLLLQFDYRGIKEEAAREALHSGLYAPGNKKVQRPFHRLIATQIDKNRRDKNLRGRIQKEKLQEQARNEKRDDLLNRAMRPRKAFVAPQKQHRNKKSMSAFLNFMRPISSAFGADLSQPIGVKRSASELDFVTSGKPVLVLNVNDARVAQFINNERSYTFKLDTEDGGHYLLQAMSKREMTKWLDTINRVTKMAAKRRLTYLGDTVKPQVSDHIHNPIVASRDPKAVFGVELEFLLRRETGGGAIPPGTIPSIIEQCLSEVETRGLSEVGIYRIAGATSEINGLKEAYNKGEFPITRSTDIHAVCDLVKSWFRVLPEPVFPPLAYYKVMDGIKMENLDERLSAIRDVVQALPQANFDLLKRVSEHLDKVTDYEESNHMTAEALAIVFSPNLLRAPLNDFAMILTNMGHTNRLVKALISHFHVIFDDSEADPEVEMHSDDESPILEEDEERGEGDVSQVIEEEDEEYEEEDIEEDEEGESDEDGHGLERKAFPAS